MLTTISNDVLDQRKFVNLSLFDSLLSDNQENHEIVLHCFEILLKVDENTFCNVVLFWFF